MNFKLQRYEDRPATIQEHRELRDEIARLQDAKRRALAIADERTIQNTALRQALMKIRDVVGTSTEAWLIAERALEQKADGGKNGA